jgi:hypothetical protein
VRRAVEEEKPGQVAARRLAPGLEHRGERLPGGCREIAEDGPARLRALEAVDGPPQAAVDDPGDGGIGEADEERGVAGDDRRRRGTEDGHGDGEHETACSDVERRSLHERLLLRSRLARRDRCGCVTVQRSAWRAGVS